MDLTPFWSRGSGNGSLWDPFRSFPDKLFDFPDPLGSDQSFFGLDWRNFGHRGKVDWVETSDAHVFKADVPGLRKENVKVEVLDGRVLNIEGERSKENFQETDSWRCMERSYGKFSRQFGLPNNAKPEAVAAKVEDGVLTVTVPKSKTEPSRVRSVPIA